MSILRLFFDEMWPYLSDSIDVLTDFIGSAAHTLGDELPRKTFTASPGFEALQRDQGELTTPFSIKGRPHGGWLCLTKCGCCSG